MKISDLYEDKKESFEENLKQEVMDVMMIYNVTGTNKTNINNIISELSKGDTSIDRETLQEIIEELGYEVVGDDILFSDNNEVSDEDSFSDGSEFDEVGNMAKQAVDKRMK